jgi:hypothetical protein
MSAAAPSVDNSWQARARDAFLLKGAERAVQALTPDQHAKIRKYYDAALRRANVANDLSDDRNVAVAFVLYREAVGLLATAVLASRSTAIDVEGQPAIRMLDALGELAAAGEIPPLPTELQTVKTILATGEPLGFDRVPAQDLLAKRAAVETTIGWLRERVEPRTLREIRATRILRLIGVTAVALVALVMLVARLTRPVNIALGKPGSISEKHPYAVCPLDNSGGTNGDIESSYGIHSNNAPPGGISWVMIDLLASYKIDKVKIYNRADGWYDDGLPLSLEFSEDGVAFTEVNRRAEPFTSRSPWSFEAHGAKTRYVRVRSAKYVALTEIEVNPAK